MAGGEQVVLLRADSCFWGAEQAAEALPAADTGAKAAPCVPGAARHALEGGLNMNYSAYFEFIVTLKVLIKQIHSITFLVDTFISPFFTLKN